MIPPPKRVEKISCIKAPAHNSYPTHSEQNSIASQAESEHLTVSKEEKLAASDSNNKRGSLAADMGEENGGFDDVDLAERKMDALVSF